VNAVLLIVGLGLLAGSGPPLPSEGTPPAGASVPEPLPQLQAPGLPAGPELTLPAHPEEARPSPEPLRPVTAPPALVPLKQLAPPPPAAPAGPPPAFRLVTPEPKQERSSLRPHIPEPAPPTPPPLPAGSVQTPTLAVDKTGPRTVRAGEPFRYEIVLRNVGPVPAARVLLEDELPPGTQVLAALPVPLAQGGRLAWQIEGLACGEEKRFQVEARAAQGGQWKGTATVMVCAVRTLEAAVLAPLAPPPAAPSAQPPAAPAPPPSAEGQVVVDLRAPTEATLGHPVVIEIHVSNRGAVPLADLVLRAHLPPGLAHFYGTDIELGLEPLGPGESRTESLEVIAAGPGRHLAELTVLSGGARPALGQTAVEVREDPYLTVRLLGPPRGATDRDHEYRIEVTNRMKVAARDVIVLDRLPPGLAPVGNIPGGTYDKASRMVRWKMGNLAAGQTRTVAMKVRTGATGPAVNEVQVRTSGGQQARLKTVLQFWPQQSQGGR
jgi:uncharacterized repeat protein (TIGR01451 family)